MSRSQIPSFHPKVPLQDHRRPSFLTLHPNYCKIVTLKKCSECLPIFALTFAETIIALVNTEQLSRTALWDTFQTDIILAEILIHLCTVSCPGCVMLHLKGKCATLCWYVCVASELELIASFWYIYCCRNDQ